MKKKRLIITLMHCFHLKTSRICDLCAFTLRCYVNVHTCAPVKIAIMTTIRGTCFVVVRNRYRYVIMTCARGVSGVPGHPLKYRKWSPTILT